MSGELHRAIAAPTRWLLAAAREFNSGGVNLEAPTALRRQSPSSFGSCVSKNARYRENSELVLEENMGVPRRKTLEDKFVGLDGDIQKSFVHFPKLFCDFPTDVSIAYLFAQIETSQINCLYCGVVKIHKVNSGLARSALESWHITRPGFKEKYKLVFGKGFRKDVSQRLEHAEKVRDDIVHGKSPKDGAMRQAVFDILEYSEMFSDQVREHAGFTPFGSLRGFKGRAKPLDRSTSKWILKGMGFI